MGVHKLVLGHVQQDCQTSFQVILVDDSVKVLIEALKGLFNGESLGEQPRLDLADHLLFPVKVVFNTSATHLTPVKYKQELVVGYQSQTFLIDTGVQLLQHRLGQRQYSGNHPTEICKRDKFFVVFFKQVVKKLSESKIFAAHFSFYLSQNFFNFFLAQLLMPCKVFHCTIEL